MLYLSVFGYLFQLVLVDDFYFPSVYRYDFFSSEGGKGSYGIARCHVRHAGELLSAEVYAHCISVGFNSISVFKYNQRFCQSSADMLLCEVYGPAIRLPQFYSQLFD